MQNKQGFEILSSEEKDSGAVQEGVKWGSIYLIVLANLIGWIILLTIFTWIYK